jgi:hypothetical protein
MTGAVDGLFGGSEGAGGVGSPGLDPNQVARQYSGQAAPTQPPGGVDPFQGFLTDMAAFNRWGLETASTQMRVSALEQQSQAAMTSAAQADFAASQDELAGRAAVVQVQQQLNKTLAAQVARYAANGIALDTGTPAVVAGATTNEANTQIAITRGNATIKAEDQRLRGQQLRQQAKQLKLQATAAGVSGFTGSLLNFSDYQDKRASLMPGTIGSPGGGATQLLPGY